MEKKTEAHECPTEWKGVERRACMMHGVHEEKFTEFDRRVDGIEGKSPLPFKTFQWAMGLTISVMISLFTISIYESHTVKEKLVKLELAQARTIVTLEALKSEVSLMKSYHRNELSGIRFRLAKRSAIFEQLVKRIDPSLLKDVDLDD